LTGLQVADLDLAERTGMVMGKGGRKRRVHFSTKTVQPLDRHVRMRKRHPRAADDALWLGRSGASTSLYAPRPGSGQSRSCGHEFARVERGCPALAKTRTEPYAGRSRGGGSAKGPGWEKDRNHIAVRTPHGDWTIAEHTPLARVSAPTTHNSRMKRGL
jgi:hypothetical protein